MKKRLEQEIKQIQERVNECLSDIKECNKETEYYTNRKKSLEDELEFLNKLLKAVKSQIC